MQEKDRRKGKGKKLEFQDKILISKVCEAKRKYGKAGGMSY